MQVAPEAYVVMHIDSHRPFPEAPYKLTETHTPCLFFSRSAAFEYLNLVCSQYPPEKFAIFKLEAFGQADVTPVKITHT